MRAAAHGSAAPRRLVLRYGALDRLQGRHVIARLTTALQREALSAKALEEHVQQRLAAVLEHAARRVPFWSKRLGAIANDPALLAGPAFASIPPLEKSEIATHAAELVTPGDSNGVTAVTSGGTTGAPTRIELDADTVDAQAAAVLRSLLWLDADPTRPHAMLWGPPPNENTYASATGRLKGFLLRRTLIPTFGLDAAGARRVLETLLRRRFHLLLGYSSALVRVAASARPGERVRVEKAVINAAEPLYDFQRAPIERVFGAPVRERYGCNEFALIAQACPEGGLHVASDRVRVDIVREDGTPASPGEMGEVLVTDLDNLHMPMIRYRIGDLAEWSDRLCACGRPYPLLARVHGRRRDRIRAADGSAISPHAFACALEGTTARGLQLVVDAQRHVRELHIEADPFDVAAVREKLRPLAPGGDLAIRFVSELVRSANGKILPVLEASA